MRQCLECIALEWSLTARPGIYNDTSVQECRCQAICEASVYSSKRVGAWYYGSDALGICVHAKHHVSLRGQLLCPCRESKQSSAQCDVVFCKGQSAEC